MDIQWIKLKTKMFDDEKIQLIEAMPEADAILIIWIKLLVQAGKTNSNGFILLAENISYSSEMLSTIFRRPLQIVKFALRVLKDLGMIEIGERNVISITNWEKHQNVEGLDKIREQNRLRQIKFREQKMLKSIDKAKKSNVTVTQGNATDKEIDIEKEEDNIILEKFGLFWTKYPRKTGKKPCEKTFTKLNPDDELFNGIMIALENQIQFGMLNNDQYTPHPATWLNQERWNDAIINKGNRDGVQKSVGASPDELARIATERAIRNKG